MVLVEVVKLIVDIDRCLYGSGDVERNGASVGKCTTAELIVIIALHGDLVNLVTHCVEYDAKTEEDNSEDSEGDHCRFEGGNGSPCWECLLLELGVLEFLYLLPNEVLLLF